jgi:hypothetical protein
MNDIIMIAVMDPTSKIKLKYVQIPDPLPDGEIMLEK